MTRNRTLAAHHRWGFVLVLALLFAALPFSFVQAQSGGVQRLSGNFSVAYQDYSELPALVALSDATGYFTGEPIYLPPQIEQIPATMRGNTGDGSYTLDLPPAPKARGFDATTGTLAENSLYIFDVRLMSDVAARGYMVPNEDNIASSLRITIDNRIAGGTLVVWAANDQQPFPTGPGPDGQIFTADDPRAALPSGWSLVDLDSVPYTVIREAAPELDLITTGAGDQSDYSALADCSVLIPTFLDRVSSVYPFTKLYNIDWAALRARLIPAANAAKTPADCQRVIRDFANAIPDGHVNYYLPALQEEVAGSLGMTLQQLSDGQIVVNVLRDNGPATDAGIQRGAIISEWEGKPIAEALRNVVLQSSNASTPHALAALQLRDLTRGPLGSKVTLTFTNPGGTPETATLTRDTPRRINAVTTEPQIVDDRLPSGLGYIRIENFTGARRLAEFDRAVSSLIAQNVPGIIIDVRSNPGGFSQMSDAMASRFFDEPFRIGRQFSPDGRLVFQMQVEPRTPIYSGPVAVLVDVNTASAGDLFAYTFKMSNRALIVGFTPSGGLAGTVSGGQYYLPDGAFIQVPTGGLLDEQGQTVIEGTGVAPDVLVPLTVDVLLSDEDAVLKAAEDALLAGRTR